MSLSLTEVYQIESDFQVKVDAALDRMIEETQESREITVAGD